MYATGAKEHILHRRAGVPWFSYSMAAFLLKLPSFITFFISSVISYGYLVSPCASVLVARPSPLSAYFIGFW
jgi:hypothetical protein